MIFSYAKSFRSRYLQIGSRFNLEQIFTKYIGTPGSGLPDFEAWKIVIHPSGLLQYPDKNCLETEACSNNDSISGHSISGLLQNPDCFDIRTLQIWTSLHPEIEFALISGFQKSGSHCKIWTLFLLLNYSSCVFSYT